MSNFLLPPRNGRPLLSSLIWIPSPLYIRSTWREIAGLDQLVQVLPLVLEGRVYKIGKLSVVCYWRSRVMRLWDSTHTRASISEKKHPALHIKLIPLSCLRIEYSVILNLKTVQMLNNIHCSLLPLDIPFMLVNSLDHDKKSYKSTYKKNTKS